MRLLPVNSRLSGLRNLSISKRRSLVARSAEVRPECLKVLDPECGLSVEQADHMVENAIGVLGVPIGIATNFTINGRDVLVPMATEESSVIAAASNAARIARTTGGFSTSSHDSLMQAQVQVIDVADPQAARLRLLEAHDELIALANKDQQQLVLRGGGAREISVRLVETHLGTCLVLHLVVAVCDAMGANLVNTMAEAIAEPVGRIAQGRILLRILSNKADLRLSRARAVFSAEALGGDNVVDDIVHATALAEADPYRAATHNKGILNGITAVVLATGNDTRAVEAGAHSHAISEQGTYTSLSHFEKDSAGNLVGVLELPMAIGVVGGATKVHPVAQTALELLGVSTARELAEIATSVGLAQNLAAVRALVTDGIQRGHMSLHARNIAVTVGAIGEEIDAVVAQLVANNRVRCDFARHVLATVRAGH
nr:hydroxymethylglutaryl-CoA reductase, degradative [Streptomyces chartreusis]